MTRDELLTTREVTDLLGVSRTTLYDWKRAGKLVPIDGPSYYGRIPQRYYRYVDVEPLIPEAQKQPRQAAASVA